VRARILRRHEVIVPAEADRDQIRLEPAQLGAQQHQALEAVVAGDARVQHLDPTGADALGHQALEPLRIGLPDVSEGRVADHAEGARIPERQDAEHAGCLACKLAAAKARAIQWLAVHDQVRPQPEVQDRIAGPERALAVLAGQS
jgi:hypothetical protein